MLKQLLSILAKIDEESERGVIAVAGLVRREGKLCVLVRVSRWDDQLASSVIQSYEERKAVK